VIVVLRPIGFRHNLTGATARLEEPAPGSPRPRTGLVRLPSTLDCMTPEGMSPLDQNVVIVMTHGMDMLSVSKAKAKFSGIARRVVRSRKPVIVRVPDGFIQIAPYELPAEVPESAAGSLKLLPREVSLHNTFGDSL
jgi:hypothetical protein